MIRTIIAIILLIITISLCDCNIKDLFTDRPNKCFDCEKELKSGMGRYMAFPTKCFDCEKQCLNGYELGKTKCFSCGKHVRECVPVEEGDKYNFMTFMRNRFINRA